jgi:PAS domain S-box-containing protein
MSDQLTDEQVRGLVENLDVALILREVEPARYVFVSSAFERIFGWPAERLMADPWFLLEQSHPDDREVVAARMADLSQAPLPEIEWRIVRPDGAVRWVRAKRTFVDTADGQPLRLAGFIEDITERKSAETELQRSREWFDAIAETVPIGFAIRDAVTLRYEYVSAAYEQIFGKPRQAFYDDPAASYSLAHPDDAALAQESFAAAPTGQPWSYEGRIIRPDGTVRWLRGHQVSVSGPGTGRWLASTVEDITERRVQQEQLRTLVEANIVGVSISDDHGVRTANDRYLDIIGYTQDDLAAGRVHWRSMTPPDWLPATEAAYALLQTEGWCPPYEKELFAKDGHRVPILVGSAVLEREPMTFSSVVLDMTEIKKVEMALRSAEADAQRANEAKSDFLSRMSHELRTPLNAVIGFGQLLALDDLSSDQREATEQIVKGGNHLLALINEVLDISRIESGGLTLSLEPVEIAEVVNEALGLVRHLGDGRRVTVEEQSPPSATYVRADRQRLRQVLLNLVTNAIKYNRDGGSVALSCAEADGDRLRLVVTDTGIGIPAAAMDRLFSPFDRLGAEHTDVEGTGLGLALTKRLVEAMGGSIGAQSVAGQGSTFWVELDLTTPGEIVEASNEPVASLSQSSDHPDVTVLYIEDNQANVRLVQRILSMREGVGALVAMQASLGLDIARAQSPDLILLDLNLPDMPGAEALRRLQADPATASIPVVVISADATPGRIARLRAEGAVDYLPKPFEISRLLALVDEYAVRRVSES